MITRRAFARHMACWAGGAALGAVGCKPSLSRSAVLHDLVERVVVPDAQAIARESRALERDLNELTRVINTRTMEQARASLRRAMLAWQRAQAFRDGPMLDTRALVRSTFWPIRRPAIAQIIRNATRVDEARASELGVDVKGVFALEHLLFEGPAPDTSWLSVAEAPAALAYARALARELCTHAEGALQSFERDAFADRFAGAGQTSLNRLVNHMLASMETIAADRLGRVLSRGAANPRDIQGGPSGVSTDLALSWLTATQRLFLGRDGRGIAALARAAAPAIEPSVRAAFARAVFELERVPKRLEVAAASDAGTLQQAITAIKELEIATKVELVSALGVNLSFISTDGD